MAKTPDRLNIDKADRELYNRINQEVFLETSRKEQFLFAMAFGFMVGVSRELGTKEGFFLAKDMGPQDEALIDAVAVSAEKGSVAVLSNRAEVYQIAEEYAHAGIRLVHDQATSGPGSFYKRFERDLFELLEKTLNDAG